MALETNEDDPHEQVGIVNFFKERETTPRKDDKADDILEKRKAIIVEKLDDLCKKLTQALERFVENENVYLEKCKEMELLESKMDCNLLKELKKFSKIKEASIGREFSGYINTIDDMCEGYDEESLQRVEKWEKLYNELPRLKKEYNLSKARKERFEDRVESTKKKLETYSLSK